MIFLTNVLAYGSRIFSSILPFIQKYWKQILYIIPLIWTMFCILKHCNAPISVPVPGQRDTIVRFIYPDTNAIIKLLGYDTEPKHTDEQKQRKQFRPTTPVFPPVADHGDSIASLWLVLNELSALILECDSFYNDAIAIRTYSDTLRTDSIAVMLSMRVEGRLRGEPDLSYKYLAPSREITITVHEYPKRKMYLEAGLGPRLLWKDNIPDAVVVNVGLGYVGKKNFGGGLNGHFTHKDYAVLISGRWYFNIER